jgi:hypothetical protein
VRYNIKTGGVDCHYLRTTGGGRGQKRTRSIGAVYVEGRTVELKTDSVVAGPISSSS